MVADPDQATRPDIALFTMVYGMKNGTITGAKLGTYVNGEKRDFYNARRTVNGIRADQVGKYQAWANEYYSQIDRLMSTAKQTPLNPAPINKTTIEPKKTENKQTSQPANTTQDPLATSEVYKGSKLTVSAEGYNWEFYHQGTETDDQGMTKINGQGIRWVLSRRDRNKTEKSLSLKLLAEKIAKAHGAKLEWLADFDPQYTFIDQTGISDYALLKREAEQNGLFVSEQNLVITIKSLRNIQDKQIVISPGSNLIGYVIQDLALDKLKDDQSSSLVQQDAKVELDILTGQFKQVKPEVDPAKDKASTGKKQEEATGTLAPGQDAIASQQKGRVKRVQGLPSRFTVVSDQAVLGLQPLDAVRTTGLPGVLSRIWLVDSVTHNLGDGTTDINCYSPIEVIGAVSDVSGLTGSSSSQGSQEALAPSSPSGSFIHGTTGTITDLRRARSATRFHHGIDIGAPTGTPVVASNDGVVTISGVQSGYGNVIYIKHQNGMTTRYGHLSQLGVRVGQQVRRGEQIGKVGNTGRSFGSHLHIEWRDANGNSLDPSQVGLPVTKGQKVSP
ncbi:peptidoglycan DD-metalloendopeptidase family protein [Aerosakkonemataceae cyanobacterium BLCC-F154]|uniref:Peptidoglycan DD-metalloendopeptidase family protein n=1 Tax=Floridaenema fluviatile BLCC-F154 TaxID=3153640 RepID=A0ABV4YHP9_9CYAN